MRATSLCIRLLLNVALLITLLNNNWAQKTDVAVLHIDPNRLQFFTYEPIRFECKSFMGTAEWRVVKKTQSEATRWEDSEASMDITPPFVTHSGEYWCENRDGERSDSLNISVVETHNVILESPVHLVMEGLTVTLRCRRKKPLYNMVSDFYKDGHFRGIGFEGTLTIHNISKSDEGLYKCSISGAGQSPESRLSVRAYSPPTSPPTTTKAVYGDSLRPLDPESNQLSVVLPMILAVLFLAVLLLVVGLLQCHKHKAACFSADTPTTELDRVHEQVGGTESQGDVYSKVAKTKKARGCQEIIVEDITYTTVTTRPKKRPKEGETHVPDLSKATYAAIKPQRKKRDSRHDKTAMYHQSVY